MTHTTNRDGNSVTTKRDTRIDLASLLTATVDGGWLPVPEITGIRDLLELHRSLLEAGGPDTGRFYEAAQIVGRLTDETAQCRTDGARSLVPMVVTELIEALRTDPVTWEQDINQWDAARGWLTHLRLVNDADQADADRAAELATVIEALGPVAPRPTPRRWTDNTAALAAAAVAVTGED